MMKKSTSKGFTLAEFVVTIAIMGTLLGVALPSYSNITFNAQDAINIANMERIKNTFSQYMFDAHIQGHPHLPSVPNNDDNLMDDDWENTIISNQVVPGRTPSDLFGGGHVPRNTNGNPFSYEMWIDTVHADNYSISLDYYIRLTDVDEDSPSFETSVTYNI
tara:strand:- start:3590 stop:4075 length:486 start_codon:yes stop_codon:yes gene_type:complete